MADKDVTILIRAKDAASAVITGVKGRISGLKDGFKDMAKGAGIAIAAIGALAAASYKLIQIWGEKERRLRLLDGALARTGQGMASARKEVIEWSNAMQGMAVDDDLAIESVTKLTEAGYDYKQAMELTNAAIALSIKNKGGDTTAAGGLVDAYAELARGSQRAGMMIQKEFGVALKDVKNHGDAVNQTLAQTPDRMQVIEDYAKSSASAMDKMKMAGDDVAEALGKGLVEGIQNAYSESGNLDDALNSLTEGAKWLGDALGTYVIPALVAIGSTINAVIIGSIDPLIQAIGKVGRAAGSLASGNFKGAFSEMSSGWGKEHGGVMENNVAAWRGAIDAWGRVGRKPPDVSQPGDTGTGGAGGLSRWRGKGADGTGGGSATAVDVYSSKAQIDATAAYEARVKSLDDELQKLDDQQTIQINNLGAAATETDRLNIELATQQKRLEILKRHESDYSAIIEDGRAKINGLTATMQGLIAERNKLAGSTKKEDIDEAKRLEDQIGGYRDQRSAITDYMQSVKELSAEAANDQSILASEVAKTNTEIQKAQAEAAQQAAEEAKRAEEAAYAEETLRLEYARFNEEKGQGEKELADIALKYAEIEVKRTKEGTAERLRALEQVASAQAKIADVAARAAGEAVAAKELQIAEARFKFRNDEVAAARAELPLLRELTQMEISRGASAEVVLRHRQEEILLLEKIEAASFASRKAAIEKEAAKGFAGIEQESAIDAAIGLTTDQEAAQVEDMKAQMGVLRTKLNEEIALIQEANKDNPIRLSMILNADGPRQTIAEMAALQEEIVAKDVPKKVYFNTEEALRDAVKAGLSGESPIKAFADRLKEGVMNALADAMVSGMMGKGFNLAGMFGGGGGGAAGVAGGGGGMLGGLLGGPLGIALGVGAMLLGGKSKQKEEHAAVQALPTEARGITGGPSLDVMRGGTVFNRAAFSSRNALGGVVDKFASARLGEPSVSLDINVKPSKMFDTEVNTKLSTGLVRANVRGVPRRTGFNHAKGAGK